MTLVGTRIPLTAPSPAAAWYPDPSQRHDERYWDGDIWTAHVRSAPRLGAMRLGAGSLDAERILFDRDVPLGPIKRRRLKLRPDLLQWGSLSVPLDRIHAVAHWAEVDQSGRNAKWDRLSYLLWGKHSTVRMVLSATHYDGKARSAQEEGFTAAVNLARQVIEPRLIRESVDRLEHGVPIRIGRLRLTSSGVVMGRLSAGRRATTSFRWTDITDIGDDDAAVLAQAGGGRQIPRQDPSERNVVLLPQLLLAAREHFA